MDRIKSISNQILEEYKSKFGENFTDNKKILDQVSIIRSKGLKNEIAGYITKFIKKEIREEKTKKAQSRSAAFAEPIPDAAKPAPETAQPETPAPETAQPETPAPETTQTLSLIHISEPTRPY